MLDIAFVNEINEDTNHFETLITKVFEETMKVEGNENYYEVSVIFVSKDKIQEINREYRGIDRVTDVISFALFDESEEDDIILDDSNITTLGDIFICFEKMQDQAKEYGHNEDREMAFLACHGLLHLLGYDHQNQDEEKIMFGKQEDILNNLNIRRM